ncbi:acetyltransferase [Nonlabens agnitus]|uniref:Uncharacterized protein n=1 Tax=Nonlabens agnitus TaxID=870484 RepID=A0A2S9WW98_9FLAO|nr:acetyltransferase [Nonlabens agnitus]PRP67750.1 hypothetical protein BST86_11925 [Nonlabens agnitus]
MKRSDLEQQYKELGNQLPLQYPNLNFKNHCYWRIALDQAVGDQWNQHISSPAYKNLSDQQLEDVVSHLKSYEQDEKLLDQHNRASLKWRGKL